MRVLATHKIEIAGANILIKVGEQITNAALAQAALELGFGRLVFIKELKPPGPDYELEEAELERDFGPPWSPEYE